jgi:prepilin-type N-terminal cleavage/methylation domain-containing protein
MKFIKNIRRGFTLIELLVVIAIIGLLASIVLVSLQTSRIKARDARRIADVHQVRIALELYVDSNKAYPVPGGGGGWCGLITGNTFNTFLSSVPRDPLDTGAAGCGNNELSCCPSINSCVTAAGHEPNP